MVWEHHDDHRETMVRDRSHAVISSPGIRSGCWGLSPLSSKGLSRCCQTAAVRLWFVTPPLRAPRSLREEDVACGERRVRRGFSDAVRVGRRPVGVQSRGDSPQG